jgi:hypothetical protein
MAITYCLSSSTEVEVWRVKNCIPPIISHASGATKSYSDINMHHAWPLVGNHFQNIDSKPSLPYVVMLEPLGCGRLEPLGCRRLIRYIST